MCVCVCVCMCTCVCVRVCVCVCPCISLSANSTYVLIPIDLFFQKWLNKTEALQKATPFSAEPVLVTEEVVKKPVKLGM